MDSAYVSDDDQTLKYDSAESDDNQTLKCDEKDCQRYNNLYDDLSIFAYELYNYFMARRFCIIKEYPEPIPVTESSEFTEEFGKAVLVVWQDINEKSKTMLDDDFPRYMERRDNFMSYVMFKVEEMINEPLNGANMMTLTQELIMVTAFLFDIYIYCYIKCCYYPNCFLPHFVEFWTKLFISFFYERFSGWENLREQCKSLSEEYDKSKTEKSTKYFKIAQFNPKYFKNDVNKIPPGGFIILPKSANEFSSYSDNDFKIIKIPDTAYCKLISRFHTVGETLKKTLSSNYRGGIRKREETLHIIYQLTDADQEVCDFDKYNCASILEEKKLEEKSSKTKSKKTRRKNK